MQSRFFRPVYAAFVLMCLSALAPALLRAEDASAEPAPVAGLLAAANVEAGAKIGHACAACHSFEKGGSNKMGPNLWNVVNRTPASVDGFAYSSALKGVAAKKWTYEELNKYLFNPRAYAAGNKMPFAGIADTQDRANVIAWLRTLSDAPAPLKGK